MLSHLVKATDHNRQLATSDAFWRALAQSVYAMRA